MNTYSNLHETLDDTDPFDVCFLTHHSHRRLPTTTSITSTQCLLCHRPPVPNTRSWKSAAGSVLRHASLYDATSVAAATMTFDLALISHSRRQRARCTPTQSDASQRWL